MKICYVVPDLGTGGAQKQLYELLASVDRSEFEPVVINMHDELTTDRVRQLDVRIAGLEYRGPGDMGKVLRIRRILTSEKPDILHCLLTSANFYGLLASVPTSVPVRIAGERSFATRFQGRVYPKVLSLADVIVTNSRGNEQRLLDTYAMPSRKVIPNGCTLPPASAPSAVRQKRQAASVMVTRSCDTFVLRSRYEGMPNALMEAMAKPGRASRRTSGVPELIEHDRTELTFEAEDDRALASCMLRLAGDPALRQRLGDNARSRMTAEFTVETMVERHENPYRSLMNGRRARRAQVAAL